MNAILCSVLCNVKKKKMQDMSYFKIYIFFHYEILLRYSEKTCFHCYIQNYSTQYNAVGVDDDFSKNSNNENV